MEQARARRRIVFDGFGTIWGVLRGEGTTFHLRPHAPEVLAELARDYDLVLWTTAPRRTLDAILAQFPFLPALFTEMITRETAPTDPDTFLTPQARLDRISKNVLLVGGSVLIDDSDAAEREGAAFGFPVLRAPTFLNGAGGPAAIETDDWFLRVPGLLRELLARQDAGGAGAFTPPGDGRA